MTPQEDGAGHPDESSRTSPSSGETPFGVPFTQETERMIDEYVPRGGCLTSWLVLGFIGNGIGFLFYLFGDAVQELMRHYRPHYPDWYSRAALVVTVLHIICLAAIWKWNKFGLVGMVALSVSWSLLSYFMFSEKPTVIVWSLLGPAILLMLAGPLWPHMSWLGESSRQASISDRDRKRKRFYWRTMPLLTVLVLMLASTVIPTYPWNQSEEGAANDSAAGPVPVKKLPPVDTSDLVIEKQPGLVAFWKFDEGKGKVARDSSGNGNHARLHGCRWTAGKYGGAIHVPGPGNYLSVPMSETMRKPGPFSFAFWLYGNRWDTGWGNSRLVHTSAYEIIVEQGKWIRFWGLDVTVPRVKTWHHIACVHNGEMVRTYIDGRLAGERAERALTTPLKPGAMVIGAPRPKAVSGDFLDGYMDDLRMYDRALSAREIKAIAQNSDRYPPPSIRTIEDQIAAASIQGRAAGPAGKDKPVAVPSPADRSGALASIREILSDEYKAAAEGLVGKRKLAQKLLDLAITTKTATERYVLLDEARRLGCELSDPAQVLTVVETTARYFKIDREKQQVAALAEAHSARKTPLDRENILSAVHGLYLRLRRDGHIGHAADAARLGVSTAKELQNKDAVRYFEGRLAELASLKIWKDKADSYRTALARNPGDAAANYYVGSYECFIMGDWDAGLKKLSQCNDANLKKAAALDLEAHTRLGTEEQVADAWWTCYQNAPKDIQRAVLRRATSWYTAMLSDATGIQRLKAQKRIAECEREQDGLLYSGALNLLDLVDLKERSTRGKWTREGNALVNQRSGSIEVPVKPEGSYQAVLEVTRVSGNNSVTFITPAGNTWQKYILCYWRSKGSGVFSVDQKFKGGAKAGHTLTNNERHRLVVNVRIEGDETELHATIDGKDWIRWRGRSERLLKHHKDGVHNARNIVLVNPGKGRMIYHSLRIRRLPPKPPVPASPAE